MNEEKKRKQIGLIAILATLCITIVEVLVILKVLPYDIIGGGRMKSYSDALSLGALSIVIQLFVVFCIAKTAGIIKLGNYKFARIMLIIFTFYFAINIVLNILGKTWFERIFCSMICVIQILCFIFLIKEKKLDRE